MNAEALNRKLVIKLVVVAVGMFGFGFALPFGLATPYSCKRYWIVRVLIRRFPTMMM